MNVSITCDELHGVSLDLFGRVILDSPGLDVLVVAYDRGDPERQNDLIVAVPDAHDPAVLQRVRRQLDPEDQHPGWRSGAK